LLQHTFIHLPRVGRVTEKELWNSGVVTWEDFLSASVLPCRIASSHLELHRLIAESRLRLESADAAYFNACVPARERWRLYAEFRERAAFLDIETTGLSPEYGHITMVGVLDSQGYKSYVYGENLEDMREALEQYDLIVTFNGTSFDLPYVEYHFGQIFRHVAHLDLRFPLKRIGYSGGLKSIETQVGVGRPSALNGLDGYDAVLLWRMWSRGDAAARDTLIRYNAEDVASLPALAELVYNRLTERLPLPCPSLAPLHRHEIGLPYDAGVVERVKAYRHSLHIVS
jgi:uncharacterized protein YprB with RNaseH-like and TPR domain